MITKQDLESLQDTVEILSNPQTMEEIKQNEKEKKNAKTITSVEEML